jgi:hypothetical protein
LYFEEKKQLNIELVKICFFFFSLFLTKSKSNRRIIGGEREIQEHQRRVGPNTQRITRLLSPAPPPATTTTLLLLLAVVILSYSYYNYTLLLFLIINLKKLIYLKKNSSRFFLAFVLFLCNSFLK